MDNALKCIDVWLRWNVVRLSQDLYINNATAHINPITNIEEYNKAYQEANARHKKAVISREVFQNEQLKQVAFEMVYHEWKNSIYLSLDLQEGRDFRYDDIDEVK